MLLVWKAFCPCHFICPQPGSVNDFDDSASSGNAAHNDDAANRNKDMLESIVEIVDVLWMKDSDEGDVESIINEQIFDQDEGMSDDSLIIYDNESMFFPMQKIKNVLEDLGNCSVDLGKGCELAS